MASNLSRIPKLIIDAIVFSNIWISIGALSLYASVRLLIHETFLIHEGALVFSATLLGYNYLKLKGLDFDANQSEFNQWMRKHKTKILALMFGFGLVFLYALFSLNFIQVVVLAFSAFVSLIYVGVERFNLRSFWFLKTQLVSFVWALFIVGVAFGSYGFEAGLSSETYLFIFLIFAAVFFFILGLTIPFDIRDWKVDSLSNEMKTLPMVFGLKGTRYLASSHMVLSLIIFYLVTPGALVLLPIYIASIFTFIRLQPSSSEYNYTLILDGMIVLVYPLLLLVN